MAGEPCIHCGHVPHANSTPGNPNGCSVIINEFRGTTCNCPTYVAPGVPPKQKRLLITMDLWPPCPWNDGSHPVMEITEEETEGGVNLQAYCCGRRETLFVPAGARLQRTMFGLRVIGGVQPQPKSRTSAAPAASMEPDKKPDAVDRFGKLEID